MDSSSPKEADAVENENGEEVEYTDGGQKSGSETGNKRKKPRRKASRSVPKKAKKKVRIERSWVWDHFTRLAVAEGSKDRATCNYCTRDIGCSSANGTTCLGNHLKVCKAYIAFIGSRSQNQHVIDPTSDGSIQLSKVTEAVFREATNEMLVLGELPLSFIESLAWKHFCRKVKLYNPHSRRTATRDIVEMYVKRKAELMEIIHANKQRISLTTDIWVAPTTGASYMVITTHFIDTSWHLQKLIIGFKNVSDHKGSTICSVLLDCLAEWGIKKIFTITVDNATANTNALEKFKDAFSLVGNDALVLGGEFLHLRCAAHIINLVVRDGLNELDASVEAIRNGVQYIRSSGKRVEAFEQKVESGKMTRGSLTLDCKTRWNSTYLMLIRALKFRSAFDRMEAEDKLYNEYFGEARIGPPTKRDWDEIERLVRFLVIFYNSTLVVSASSNVSSHKCYNEIVTIERNLITLSQNSDEKLRSKANAMRAKFDKYWGGVKEINRLLIIASVFDPRNKMKFAGLCFDKLYGKDSAESKEVYESVYSVLIQLFEEYSNDLTKAGLSSQTQSAAASFQSEQETQSDNYQTMDLDSDLEYVRMDTLYTEMVNEIGFQDASTELELYLKEKVVIPKTNQLGIPFDVLGWWRLNAPKYPVLAAIAKDIFAMQVSSVASESAFSTSNRILEPSRSCLTHYTLEVLMCTQQWLKSEIYLNEKGAVTTQQLLDEIELQDTLQKEFESKCKL